MEEYEKFISNYYQTLKNTPTADYSIDCKLNLYYRIIMLELRHIMAKHNLDNRATNLVSLGRMIEPLTDIKLREFEHELRVLQESNDYRQYPNANYYELSVEEFESYEKVFNQILQLLRREGKLRLGGSKEKVSIKDIRSFNKLMASQLEEEKHEPQIMDVTEYDETPATIEFEIKERKHEVVQPRQQEAFHVNSFHEPIIVEPKQEVYMSQPEHIKEVEVKEEAKYTEPVKEERVEYTPPTEKVVETTYVETKVEPKVEKPVEVKQPKKTMERIIPSRLSDEDLEDYSRMVKENKKKEQPKHDLVDLNAFSTIETPKQETRTLKKLMMEDSRSRSHRTINVGGTQINPGEISKEIGKGGFVDYE